MGASHPQPNQPLQPTPSSLRSSTAHVLTCLEETFRFTSPEDPLKASFAPYPVTTLCTAATWDLKSTPLLPLWIPQRPLCLP